jgi:hypothetical protein
MVRTNHALVSFLCCCWLSPFQPRPRTTRAKIKRKKEPDGNAGYVARPEDIEQRNLLNGRRRRRNETRHQPSDFYRRKDWRLVDRSIGSATPKATNGSLRLAKKPSQTRQANRLLWALGYETEIAYLIPKLKIEGKGEYENVRLEARPKDVKRSGNWMWENNPFIERARVQGPQILMVMINNWDMKDDNNEILAPRAQLARRSCATSSAISAVRSARPAELSRAAATSRRIT